MRFIELFCGIGGFRYGLKQASSNNQSTDNKCDEGFSCLVRRDFSCVWANDIDRYASAIYRYRFGDKELFEGDIRAVDPVTIPDHDLIVGGFPCQSFSIAGKRGGFEDTRGTLFFEICRIARAKGTKYLFLENAKGLLNHNQGKTFETIIRTLDELGYDCEWQVLNSKNYGVPQNRERVFIIANLRGERRFQVFPIGETDSTYSESNEWRSQATPTGYNLQSSDRYPQSTSWNARVNTSSNEDIPTVIEDFYPDMVRVFEDSPTLRGDRQGLKVLDMSHIRQESRLREYDEFVPSMNTCGGGWGAKTGLYEMPETAQALQTDGQLRTGSSWGTNKPQSARSIRRLTPIECERLQGFPDNWTKYGIINGKQVGISDSQRYKCCGNAVTTSVITEIGKRIIK